MPTAVLQQGRVIQRTALLDGLGDGNSVNREDDEPTAVPLQACVGLHSAQCDG